MKSRKLLVVLVAVLLGTGLAGCTFYNKLQARNHLNKGVESYTAKNFDAATGEFKAAVELDPTLVDAYLYLAASYRAQFVPQVPTPENLRRGQEAIASFQKVLELDPKSVNAMANIADIYRNMNEPDKAKEWYRKLMDVQEDDSQALYGIATINYNIVDEKTGKDGENVPNLTDEERAEANRMADEAIASLKQALEINKNYTDAMEYLNLLYREKAELAENEEEKDQWEKEADKLALQALETKRALERRAEQERRQIFKSESASQGTSKD
ncbi:MAG: tetratricopeptide repeat protein [Acidobacteriota bacterium]|jgi:tetratricopeptide (TPR) repeat protein